MCAGLAQTGSAAILSSTIVAQNTGSTSAPDIKRFGTLFALNSLIGDCALSGLPADYDGDKNGNIIGSISSVIDARRGEPGDNRGSTATHLLLAGSPVSIVEKIPVQQVSYEKLRARLLTDGQVLELSMAAGTQK